jgi:hypothetical protein
MEPYLSLLIEDQERQSLIWPDFVLSYILSRWISDFIEATRRKDVTSDSDIEKVLKSCTELIIRYRQIFESTVSLSKSKTLLDVSEMFAKYSVQYKDYLKGKYTSMRK